MRPVLRLLALVFAVALVAVACGNDDDNGGGASGNGGDATPTATATSEPSGDACDQVTQAEVESGASGFSAVNNWECDTVDDRPWIGGSGVLASSGEDENFILETGGDVAFVEYTGACENPPVPQSLLMFCES